MPSHFTSRLKNLIRNLLQTNPGKRFGNQVNGVGDIKHHLWFEGINWRAIANKEVCIYNVVMHDIHMIFK